MITILSAMAFGWFVILASIAVAESRRSQTQQQRIGPRDMVLGRRPPSGCSETTSAPFDARQPGGDS